MQRIPACAVSIAGLNRLYAELSKKTREALERELASLQRRPDVTQEQFDALKEEARNVGGLSVMILGNRGEQRLSNTTNPFERQDLPEVVTNITFDSAAALQS